MRSRPPALAPSRLARPRVSQEAAKTLALRGVRAPRSPTHALPFQVEVHLNATLAHTTNCGVSALRAAVCLAGATPVLLNTPLRWGGPPVTVDGAPMRVSYDVRNGRSVSKHAWRGESEVSASRSEVWVPSSTTGRGSDARVCCWSHPASHGLPRQRRRRCTRRRRRSGCCCRYCRKQQALSACT